MVSWQCIAGNTAKSYSARTWIYRMVVVCIFIWQEKMAEGIMQRQNRKQIEVLRRFQNESAFILRQEDLFKLLVGVVNEMFPVKDIFVFIKNGRKVYGCKNSRWTDAGVRQSRMKSRLCWKDRGQVSALRFH